jgi:hypothetical protein
MKYVLLLPEIADGDREGVGLTAYDMARLYNAGIPLPRALCVTTEPCRIAAEELGLDRIERKMTPASTGEKRLTEDAVRMQELLRERGIGEALMAELEEALSSFEYKLVEVTLSPVAATYDAAAVAGLRWSGKYLPLEAVADAVLECWAALYETRALRFRLRLGMEPGSLGAAVLVAESRPAPLEGRIVPTGDEADAWTIHFEPRIRGPRELAGLKAEKGKPPSLLTTAQAQALTTLAEGTAEALGEQRALTWTFEGTRFTITGIPW